MESFTIKLNDVVRIRLSEVAVTVTGYVPGTLDFAAWMVMTVLHDGEQLVDENEAAAPDGSPETANDTGPAGFAISVATMSVAPELFCGTVTFPVFDRAKSNGE